jgi:curved DNA-binding protein CbpA
MQDKSGSASVVHRQLLGLPTGRAVTASEIRQAFKQAAKSAHPDRGGDRHAFASLVAARDALMKAD